SLKIEIRKAEPESQNLIRLTGGHILSEPVPQYVFGCLPAIAIVGASPANKFTKRGNKESRCLFWLSVDNFEDNQHRGLSYRPVGMYTMKWRESQDININKYVDRCTAKVSVLERLSSIIPMYYIIIGAMEGISTATGSTVCEDWPYIPLLLSWTIPALWRRISSGNLVVKDPKVEFENRRIIMIYDHDDKSHKCITVFLTAFISIVFPWITVILAFLKPPIGFSCRIKYITIICSIWSFNNALAYLWHLKGEKDLIKPLIFHVWFSICGFIIAILLFVLGLFNKNPEWWVDLFGQSCDISNAGC
ncbi:13825_t:CDS:2, partial [Dentiscutata heterogama]